MILWLRFNYLAKLNPYSTSAKWFVVNVQNLTNSKPVKCRSESETPRITNETENFVSSEQVIGQEMYLARSIVTPLLCAAVSKYELAETWTVRILLEWNIILFQFSLLWTTGNSTIFVQDWHHSSFHWLRGQVLQSRESNPLPSHTKCAPLSVRPLAHITNRAADRWTWRAWTAQRWVVWRMWGNPAHHLAGQHFSSSTAPHPQTRNPIRSDCRRDQSAYPSSLWIRWIGLGWNGRILGLSK